MVVKLTFPRCRSSSCWLSSSLRCCRLLWRPNVSRNPRCSGSPITCKVAVQIGLMYGYFDSACTQLESYSECTILNVTQVVSSWILLRMYVLEAHPVGKQTNITQVVCFEFYSASMHLTIIQLVSIQISSRPYPLKVHSEGLHLRVNQEVFTANLLSLYPLGFQSESLLLKVTQKVSILKNN